ncbi:MAG: hypothetical protein NVS3B20_09220 [Polyangiales bacterium]
MQAPIFRFNEQRDQLVEAVVGRVVAEARDPVLLLNDAAYHEIRRLETMRGPEREDIGRWRKLARSLGQTGADAARNILGDVARGHARDVNGNFDRRVYKLASRVLPMGLSVLLNPQVLARHSIFDIVRGNALSDRIATSGPLERIKKLTEIGTVVYVPTHLSNLDSPVFAHALESCGLPPVTYGAGKNLFSNPVLSFFMRNLGAYRVDRRLKHELYKTVLKSYSSILIERGFHSLFFPGGTRSRSGGVERKLKLGLAGTGLEAFVRTSLAGKPRRVFFVPATINYMLTLEAETLIEDTLKEQGKSRYIIDDDESTRLGRMTAFGRKLFQMEGSCAVRFGTPLDPFGNEVDDAGISHDRRGRPVDPRTYVTRGHDSAQSNSRTHTTHSAHQEHNAQGTQSAGEHVNLDFARDAQYTRELGEVVMAAYLRDTIAMPTHVVATAAFAKLRASAPNADLFALVRKRDEVVVPEAEMVAEVAQVQARLATLESKGAIVLSSSVRGATARELLRDAERAFNGYHSSPVLRARDGGVALVDPKLLLYYQNRLAAHGVSWGGGAR